MSHWSRVTSSKRPVFVLPQIKRPSVAVPVSVPIEVDDVAMVEDASKDSAAAWRHAVDSLPTSAVRQLDEWAEMVMATPPFHTATMQESALFQRRMADTLTFAKKWVHLREMATDSVLVPDGSTSPETILLDRFFEDTAKHGWLYRDRQVYSQRHGYVRVCGSLEHTLNAILEDAAAVVQEHFHKMPSSLRRVSEIIHDTFLKESRSLQVDATRIMFENETAQLSAGGIDVVATPTIMAERPFVPRAYVHFRLDVADYMHTSWMPPSEYLHHRLLAFVGAMLRPSFLRMNDNRPVLLVATCPETVMHPLIFILRTFCDLAITTKLEETYSGTVCTHPYVLLVEAQYFPLTEDKMATIRTALNRNMVVVIHALDIPPMFFLESQDFLRLCAVHIDCRSQPTPDVLDDIAKHILPASQAAYNRETVLVKRHLTYLSELELYPFRVDGKGGSEDLLLEMLQGRIGMELRPAGLMSHIAVADAYVAYCCARKLEEKPVAIEDVLKACRKFRDMFGHRSSIQVVVYMNDTASFCHLASC
jgi:hypothetical protein